MSPGLAALDAVALARQLIGATLTVDGVGGIIVETEAYEADDPASHSFIGERPRNRAMFGPPLTAYVYRSYGMHWCVNVVAGPEGHGAAVLIRALEPVTGIAAMIDRRRQDTLRLLCAGPGRLTEALGISRDHDGLPLSDPPFHLRERDSVPVLASGQRIGISKAVDRLWRFGLAGSPYLSRPFAQGERRASGPLTERRPAAPSATASGRRSAT